MKNYLYPLLISLVVLFLHNSCKKEQIDYREKYYGEWFFITEFYEDSGMGDIQDADTIYNHLGYISNESFENINIEFRENNMITVKVSLDGEISDSVVNQYPQGYFINHDSLFLIIKDIDYLYVKTQVIFGKKIEY